MGRAASRRPSRSVFSADEGLDIGVETGTAVAPECDVESSELTGEIRWIQLRLGDDDHTHQLPADAHLSALMGRQ